MEMDNGGDPKPMKPEEPKPGECCGEGCRVCVWDLYQERLDKYKTDLITWEERQVKAVQAPTSIFVPIWRYVPLANKLAPSILKHLR